MKRETRSDLMGYQKHDGVKVAMYIGEPHNVLTRIENCCEIFEVVDVKFAIQDDQLIAFTFYKPLEKRDSNAKPMPSMQ